MKTAESTATPFCRASDGPAASDGAATTRANDHASAMALTPLTTRRRMLEAEAELLVVCRRTVAFSITGHRNGDRSIDRDRCDCEGRNRHRWYAPSSAVGPPTARIFRMVRLGGVPRRTSVREPGTGRTAEVGSGGLLDDARDSVDEARLIFEVSLPNIRRVTATDCTTALRGQICAG